MSQSPRIDRGRLRLTIGAYAIATGATSDENITVIVESLEAL